MHRVNYYEKYIRYRERYLLHKATLIKQQGGARVVDTKSLPSHDPNKYKGDTKDGNDGHQYLSVADKNGTYHWKKLKEMDECKSANEYYSQFNKYVVLYDTKELVAKLSLVQKELEKSKIHMVSIGWTNVWDIKTNAQDDALDYLAEKLGIGHYDVLDTSYMFYQDHGVYWSGVEGKMYIQHNILKKDLPTVTTMFKKHFGDRFVEPLDSKKAIVIKLNKL